MKNTGTGKGRSRVSEDLRAEYHFDYTKAKRNRFAARAQKGPLVVVLDEDIARVFRTPESVKAVLRSIIMTMPARNRRAAAKRTPAG
jgi:hypothetical protein